MSSRPRFQDKIDVLDILISILKDHEGNLSNTVDKLDAFIKNLSSLEKKIAKVEQILQHKKFTPVNDRRFIYVECKKWSEFREVSTGASLVAFEAEEKTLSISSAFREIIFKYSEDLPWGDDEINMQSGDLVCCKVLNLDSFSVRRWLSEELKVPEDKIVEGRLFTS